jgi:alpha-1,3-rhamnosyl/mannosyltransferase
LPEVVGDAGFVVEPDDVDGLSAAIRAILTDPIRAAGAVERGIRRARQYSWDASAAVLLDAYREAIVRRRSKAR